MSTALYAIAALVVAVVLLRWRGSKLLRAFFHPLTERGRLSFFDAYPVGPEDVVLLGDSIAAGGSGRRSRRTPGSAIGELAGTCPTIS